MQLSIIAQWMWLSVTVQSAVDVSTQKPFQVNSQIVKLAFVILPPVLAEPERCADGVCYGPST